MTSFNDLINGDQPVLVDFHAAWCGPCKTMGPIVQEVKNALGDTVKVIKIDIDKNKAATEEFMVNSVPTFILFKNGEILWRQSGAIPKMQLFQSIHNAIQ
jgi:thioredoxin 1